MVGTDDPVLPILLLGEIKWTFCLKIATLLIFICFAALPAAPVFHKNSFSAFLSSEWLSVRWPCFIAWYFSQEAGILPFRLQFLSFFAWRCFSFPASRRGLSIAIPKSSMAAPFPKRLCNFPTTKSPWLKGHYLFAFNTGKLQKSGKPGICMC